MKTVSITQKDLVISLRLNFLQCIRGNSKKIVFSLLFFYIVFCLLVCLQGFPINGIIACTLFPLSLLLIWFILLPYTAKKQIKSLSSQCDVHWDESYLCCSNIDSNSKVSWKIFSKIVENNHCFLLYSQSCLFHIFPKRYFESESELQDFKRNAIKGIADHQANAANTRMH